MTARPSASSSRDDRAPVVKALLHHTLSATRLAALRGGLPGWVRLATVAVNDRAGLARELADAEVLLHVLEPVTAATLDAAPLLRLVQKIGVGVNTIDLEAARSRGVAVANMPGTNSQAVAEMTLTLMLAVARLLPSMDAAVRTGRGWTQPPDAFDGAFELSGKTVGLVGFGGIPQRLAPVLHALGAVVIAHTRSRFASAHADWVPLPELLARADIVSLHLPLTEQTRHLVNEASLARMKPGAVLVNTARGALVDEAALVRALQSGRLRAAGLDVFADEPVPTDSPLLRLPNVVLAPHVAWLTPETLERSFSVVAENCARLRDGRALLHEVVPGGVRAG